MPMKNGKNEKLIIKNAGPQSKQIAADLKYPDNFVWSHGTLHDHKWRVERKDTNFFL